MGGGRGGGELDLMLNSMTLHVLALCNVVKEKALSGDGFIVYLFRIPVSFHNVKTVLPGGPHKNRQEITIITTQSG